MTSLKNARRSTRGSALTAALALAGLGVFAASATIATAAGLHRVTILADGAAAAAPAPMATDMDKPPATVSPTTKSNNPYWNDEAIVVKTPVGITGLSVTINLQASPGLAYKSMYSTAGPDFALKHSITPTAITYQYVAKPDFQLAPGTYTFSAQANGTGTPHSPAGDTYVVTYSANGKTYTQGSKK